VVRLRGNHVNYLRRRRVAIEARVSIGFREMSEGVPSNGGWRFKSPRHRAQTNFFSIKIEKGCYKKKKCLVLLNRGCRRGGILWKGPKKDVPGSRQDSIDKTHERRKKKKKADCSGGQEEDVAASRKKRGEIIDLWDRDGRCGERVGRIIKDCANYPNGGSY